MIKYINIELKYSIFPNKTISVSLLRNKKKFKKKERREYAYVSLKYIRYFLFSFRAPSAQGNGSLFQGFE